MPVGGGAMHVPVSSGTQAGRQAGMQAGCLPAEIFADRDLVLIEAKAATVSSCPWKTMDEIISKLIEISNLAIEIEVNLAKQCKKF